MRSCKYEQIISQLEVEKIESIKTNIKKEGTKMNKLYELTYKNDDNTFETCFADVSNTDQLIKIAYHFINSIVERKLRNENKIIYKIAMDKNEVIYHSSRVDVGDDEFDYDDLDHERQLVEDLVIAKTEIKEVNYNDTLKRINNDIPYVDHRRDLTLVKKIEEANIKNLHSLQQYCDKNERN